MKGDRSLLYIFTYYSAIVASILLITVLKPHRLYKKMLWRFFNIEFKYHGGTFKIYNILILFIIFYGLLFAVVQMQVSSFTPSKNDDFVTKMTKLDNKWIQETIVWLAFIIILSFVSIYRNAVIFNEEEDIKKQIAEIDKQIAESKKK